MKGLFLLLLVMNAGYFAWEYFRPVTTADIKVISHPNAQALVLLQEIALPQVSNSASPEPDKSSQGAATEPKLSGITCHTLGPFRDRSRVDAFSETIRGMVSEVAVREREQRDRSVYWVYLKPTDFREDAVAIARKLKQQNIKDYYIINSGAKLNGISLGHYRESERGFRHTRRLRELGFDAQIEPIYRVYPIYWLDYQINPSQAIPQTIIDQYLSQDINRLARDCSS